MQTKFFIISYIILCVLYTSAAESSIQNNIQILQSDADGITIEYIPYFHKAEKLLINGTEFHKYDFDNSRSQSSRTPGTPDIRFRSYLLDLSSKTGNSVDIISFEYEDISNVTLLPTPNASEGELGATLKYEIDPIAYSVLEFMPENIATLTNIGETRGIILGELQLCPMQYNAATRTLRKYERIVVHVSFGKQDHFRIEGDKLVKGIAINENIFDEAVVSIKRLKVGTQRNSVLNDGKWFRFQITEDGMYKLTGSDLIAAGIPAATNLNTIKIFGNGGYELPLDVTSTYVNDLLENAVQVYDGGNIGQLDQNDYIVFYAKGVRGWKYNQTNKTFNHYINHFTETNYYYLAYDKGISKKMAELQLSSEMNKVPAIRFNTVIDKIFREDEKINLLSSGQEWLGQIFNAGDQMIYVHSLSNLDISQPITYKFRVGARSTGASNFIIQEHNTHLITTGHSSTQVGSYYSKQFIDATVMTSIIPTFTDNKSQLRFSFNSSSSTGNGYIDWYEIFYSRFLKAQNDLFSFHTVDSNIIAEYVVSGFSSGTATVYDVTKFDSVLIIPSQSISPDTCLFQIQTNTGNVREIYVVGQNGLKKPGRLYSIQNQNLHGDTSNAEYVIITHSDFIDAAQKLERFRSNNLKTIVVDVENIYNEFSSGVPTIVAIRNYLRYIYNNWSTPPNYLPRYVLLLGDGDFDYKRIISSGTNWIPPWETLESFWPLHTYASDDDFVTFDTGRRVAIGIGRLTVRSASEANSVIEKIIEYESHPINDPWKTRITFVADDGLAGASEPNNLFLHTSQAELISQEVPPVFDKRKIFLYEYPTIYTSAGRRKPEANLAIQNQINQGTLVLNFTGHGNPRLWTHEAVFVRETDFPLLNNSGKYFILIAATCNYSNFDAINDQSSGEILVTMANSGAIASFCASRVVFAGDNFSLNRSMYKYLFDVDSLNNIKPTRLGDVIFRTKQENFGGTADNDRKFLLIGDPAQQISFPKMSVSIDTINNIRVGNSVQLQALGKSSIRATIRDSAANPQNDFNGTALLSVFDAARMVELEDYIQNPPNPPSRVTYSFQKSGNVIYRGEQSILDGKIAANFIIPKDVSYSDDSGRITLYFWNSTTDGFGYSTKIRIGGTDTNAVQDNQGPTIKLFLENRNFRAGDVVSANPSLIVDLFDTNGINTSNAGIGHNIEAWLDDKLESISLSDYYKSKINTYQEGTVQYSMGELSHGTHKLKLRAWDTYNNSSIEQVVFDVVTKVGLKVFNVFNYPNPFSNKTYFTFKHNQSDPVDAEIKIYSVAGRMIKSIEKKNITDEYVQIEWDGLDRDGDMLANGVYLYKVIVKTLDKRFSSEEFGKLSLIK